MIVRNKVPSIIGTTIAAIVTFFTHWIIFYFFDCQFLQGKSRGGEAVGETAQEMADYREL